MLRLIPRLADENPDALLAMGLPLQLARILWARGVHTPQEAEAFLHPSTDTLHDPLLLHDMRAAVQRIRAAMDAGEPITVYGDYDVDGVCASAILVEALRAHGAQADWYIPSRHKEGYGLNPQAVEALAQRTQLLVTVDCGITSTEEAQLAKALGLDLIITDHHEPPERLPEAIAVVDPLLGAYPFPRLCGAGVAFKLVWALFGQAAVESLWELAALATVADIVPLLGENRIIVREGLARMQQTGRPGLKALRTVSGLDGKVLTAGHLGYLIGPRINAGGRLHEASRSVQLLLTGDAQEARETAEALNSENTERQRMEGTILAEADQWVRANMDFLSDRAIVAVGKGWNTGVVGLVASRLVERYAWPTIVLSENEEGILTGSARSIPGVNIHAALTQCADLFMRFGGHAQAAGMTLEASNLPALRLRLNEAIADIAEPDAFIPSLPYDVDITLPEVTIPLIEQFEQLAPTGFGNPSPVFRLSGAQVLEARGVGADGKHLKLRLAQEAIAVDGIAFGQGSARAGLPQRVDALFSPTINEYMGKRSAQCEIARLLPHAPLDTFLSDCRQRADDFDCYLLDPPALAAPVEEAVLRSLVAEALGQGVQGTLLLVRTLQGAQLWLQWLQSTGMEERLDFCFGQPTDQRRFNTFCAMPSRHAAEGYPRVFCLDDMLVRDAAAAWLPTDDALRTLYRTLRKGQGRFASELSVCEAAGLRVAAVRLGLRTFADLSLITYTAVPFSATLLPTQKCDLNDSGTLRTIRDAYAWEGQA